MKKEMGVQVQEQLQQEMRKGPWTEHEDILLVNYVQLFGDRRWDFIANVSGLNRTGKSCRLRWVNYLHPGLKHGKMTLQEERLVLELHAKWGNRWSRIARKLPGRTDNEIKNYWRTHMRKMAQGSKRGGGLSSSATSSRPPSPSSSSSSSSSNCSAASSSTTSTVTTQGKASFYDTGGNINDDEMRTLAAAGYDQMGGYSMDDIWKDIELSEEKNIIGKHGGGDFGASPANWDFCWDAMWKMGEESQMKLMMTSDGAAADDAKFISSWAAAETCITG